MDRAHKALALLLMLSSGAAIAGEDAADLDIPGGPVGAAVRSLALRTHASIGFRDPALARLVARAVHGRYPARRALDLMLIGTGCAAREVAPDSFVIEAARRPDLPRPPASHPRAAPQALSAPPPMSGDSDNIVVTATKRDVPLDYYPGAVTLVDGNDIATADARRGTDMLTARVPSVSSTQLGPGRNKLFIRGISDSSIVGPTQATVGQYWGNSRITYSAPDPDLRLYDVARIEVLEGPQGTLYGAGSLGGVVRVVPNAPDLTHLGGAAWAGGTVTQHGAPGGDGGALLNVPIVDDKLGLRILAFDGLDGGYIYDRERQLNNVNTVKTLGGRAELRYRPGNDWTIDVSGVAQRIAGDDAQYTDGKGDGLSRASSIAQPYHNTYYLGDVVAARRWGAMQLTASVGYANQDVFEQYEGAALPQPSQPGIGPAQNAPQTAYTQDNRVNMLVGEVRLSRRGPRGTGWLIGLSAIHNRSDVHRTMGGDQGHQPDGGNTNAPVAKSLLTGVTNRVDEFTLYGEYAQALASRLTLTVGARFTHTWLSGHSNDDTQGIALIADPGATATRNENRVLPAVSLAWHPAAALTLYTRFQEGFRPGGIAVSQNQIQRFNADTVYTLESGGRLGGAKASTSFSVAWVRWLNIQADLIDGYGFPTTANIGDGRILSFGWTGQWRPLTGLQLDAAAYHNASRVLTTSAAAQSILGASISENRLPNVADLTVRGSVAYTLPAVAGERIDLHGSVLYVGKSTLGVGTVLGRLQGNYADTSLEIRSSRGRRSISLGLDNLLDARGNRFSLGSPFLLRTESEYTPMQPRNVRLGFDLAF